MPQSALNYLYSTLTGVGFAPEQASALSVSIDSAVAATGSLVSDAYQAQADYIFVRSAASNNNGIRLRSGKNYARRQVIINGGASSLTVYPPYNPPGQTTTVGSINNLTSVSLASGTAAIFYAYADGQYWKE